MSKFMRLRDYILYVSTENTVIQEFWEYNRGLEDIYLPTGETVKDVIEIVPSPSPDEISAIINQAIVNQAIAV